MSEADQHLIESLADRVGAAQVVAERDLLKQYRGIAWGPPTARLPLPRQPGPPLAAVLPRDVDDVVAAVIWANQTGTPVVPYGSGTGVHAGATPLAGAIVIDLGAMREVISISATDRSARVQPGIVLGELDRQARGASLMVGHDPWSQPLASVGGAISTNGVGYLAGKYGSMGQQVLAIEAVMGSGTVLRTRAVPKSSTGPALRHLFIGAEGLFGIITEVDVQLFPVPERRALDGFRFLRFEDGLEAVMEMAAIQLRPSMIDFEEDEPDAGALKLRELVDLSSPMFLAFEGFAEEVAAQVDRASRICRRCKGKPMHPSEVQHFWDTRHESAERWLQQREHDPDGLARPRRQWSSTYVNIGLPASTILAYRLRAAQELADYHLAVKASGVWGIPELYSVKFQHMDPDRPFAGDELEAGTDRGLRLAQELGGSMEYCHGVGLRLAHLMADELGTGLDVLRDMKKALDPCNILNPGKLGL